MCRAIHPAFSMWGGLGGPSITAVRGLPNTHTHTRAFLFGFEGQSSSFVSHPPKWNQGKIHPRHTKYAPKHLVLTTYSRTCKLKSNFADATRHVVKTLRIRGGGRPWTSRHFLFRFQSPPQSVLRCNNSNISNSFYFPNVLCVDCTWLSRTYTHREERNHQSGNIAGYNYFTTQGWQQQLFWWWMCCVCVWFYILPV